MTKLDRLFDELAVLVLAKPVDVPRISAVRAEIQRERLARARRSDRREILFTINGHHGPA